MSKAGADLTQNQLNFNSDNNKNAPNAVSNSVFSSKFNHFKSKSHNYNNNISIKQGNFAETSTKFPSIELTRSNIISTKKAIENQPLNMTHNLNLEKSPSKIHYHKGIPKMKNSSNNIRSNTVFQPLNNLFPKDNKNEYFLSRNEDKNVPNILKMEKTINNKINILRSTMKVLDKDIENTYNKYSKIKHNNNNFYSTNNNNINKESVNFSKRKLNNINSKNSANISKDFNNTISNNNSDKNINNNNFYVNSVQKQSKNTFRKGSHNNNIQQNTDRFNFNHNTQKQIVLKDPSQLNSVISGQNKASNTIHEDILIGSPFIKGYGSIRADDNLYSSISELKLNEIYSVKENKNFNIKKTSKSPTKDFSKSFNNINLSLPLNKDEQRALNLRTLEKVKKNNEKSKSTNYNEVNSISNTITENKCINQSLKAITTINCISYKSLPGKINSFQSKMNQDSFLIMTNVLGLSGFCILGVFDGHGTFGHLVSDYVKKFFENYFRNFDNYTNSKSQLILTSEDVYKKIVDNNYNLLYNAFTTCENSLSKEVDFDTRLSGTTSILVICVGENLICANAGDSRAMMSSKTGIKNLSYDHKPEKHEEKVRILKAGGKVHPTKELGKFVGPCRVWVSSGDYPGLAMSRSIGDFMAKSVGCTCAPGKIKYLFLIINYIDF